MTVTARTPLYLKPRLRQLRHTHPNPKAPRWWCTWPDGSVGFGPTERAALDMAREASEFKDRLHRRHGGWR